MKLKKIDDWELRIRKFLVKCYHKKFQWGEHDCCIFLCDCIESMTGYDLSLPFRGKYTTKTGAAKTVVNISTSVFGLVDVFAKKYRFKKIKTNYAQNGDIIGLLNHDGDESLGILIGERILFAGDFNLESVEISHIKKVWRI